MRRVGPLTFERLRGRRGQELGEWFVRVLPVLVFVAVIGPLLRIRRRLLDVQRGHLSRIDPDDAVVVVVDSVHVRSRGVIRRGCGGSGSQHA